MAVSGDRLIPKTKVLENRDGGGLVAKSCQTLCDPINCSLPGCSVHDFPGKNTRVGCHLLLQGVFPDLPHKGIKPMSPALQVDSLPTEPPGKPIDLMICENLLQKCDISNQ